MGLEERKVESQIAYLILQGLLEVNQFVDKETYELIKSKIPLNEEWPRLIPIKQSLPYEVSFAQISYVIRDLKIKKN